jgi:hypothetical protein
VVKYEELPPDVRDPEAIAGDDEGCGLEAVQTKNGFGGREDQKRDS